MKRYSRNILITVLLLAAGKLGMAAQQAPKPRTPSIFNFEPKAVAQLQGRVAQAQQRWLARMDQDAERIRAERAGQPAEPLQQSTDRKKQRADRKQQLVQRKQEIQQRFAQDSSMLQRALDFQAIQEEMQVKNKPKASIYKETESEIGGRRMRYKDEIQGTSEPERKEVEAKKQADSEKKPVFTAQSLMDACRKGDCKLVQQHIDKGINTDICDKTRRQTPLIVAVRSQNTELVDMLLKTKKRINREDNCGLTALSYALFLNNKLLSKMLRAAGAKEPSAATLDLIAQAQNPSLETQHFIELFKQQAQTKS